MTHKPLTINSMGLSFPHKICFEDFSTTIQPGSKIGIMGQNGSGKSTLLSMLLEEMCSSGVTAGMVQQIVDGYDDLSGGQKFNKAMSEVLSGKPDVLLLDEPTNHLDMHNRKSLLRMLNSYASTLIVVSHDEDVLRTMDVLWHIYNGQINVFSGAYDDYKRSVFYERQGLESELHALKKRRNAIHEDLMREQKRASKAAEKGRKSIDQRKWPTIVSNSKFSRAQETTCSKKMAIKNNMEEISGRLQNLYIPEIIKPTFSLNSGLTSGSVLSISGGGVSYGDKLIVGDININLCGNDRMAISGRNGSGKSTILKAILGDPSVLCSGMWILPKPEQIGYLDQNYSTLNPTDSVIESLASLVPDWSHDELRKYLNDFLFRKNEEVCNLVRNLSGGEKARLCLVRIAAKPPKLLILDEVTNNLDLETRNHVIQVLKDYSGAMVVISHDEVFLKEIGVGVVCYV